jgi:hypothetical protein
MSVPKNQQPNQSLKRTLNHPATHFRMNTLQELQKWYQSQCDGEWEHRYGLDIGTLDNPGWSVKVDLAGTSLAEQSFTEVRRLEHETDWIHCQVREGAFEGRGGPSMLEEILRIFLAWAVKEQTA